MSLGLLEAKLPSDAEAAWPIAREARQAVAAALAELRELSQGIYPAALAECGLAGALEDLCQRAALPTFIEVSVDHRRLPAEVEAAVYFLVSEALTNAVKHAVATEVRVDVALHEDRVVAEFADDGKGGAIPGVGSGAVRSRRANREPGRPARGLEPAGPRHHDPR
jgi:signal transduction histidine kinase